MRSFLRSKHINRMYYDEPISRCFLILPISVLMVSKVITLHHQITKAVKMLAFVWFAYQSETNGGQVRKMSLGFVQVLVLPRWQEYYPREGTKTWLWCTSPRILQGLGGGQGGGYYTRGRRARGRQKVLRGQQHTWIDSRGAWSRFKCLLLLLSFAIRSEHNILL